MERLLFGPVDAPPKDTLRGGLRNGHLLECPGVAALWEHVISFSAVTLSLIYDGVTLLMVCHGF